MTKAPRAALLDDVSPLSGRFPVWFCDIWGVVHDGVAADAEACRALAMHRRNGGVVILISNSPRPRKALIEQIDGFGVPRDAWDDIVTSGDVTQAALSRHPGAKVFHLGPPKDARLRDGLPVTFTGEEEAQMILCSGLYDDRNEQPEEYREMLARLAERRLPMICANPDIKVRHGGKVIPCGGALAMIYEELGGEVLLAGKPYAPIYEMSMEKARAAAGRGVDKGEILAIGDGPATDMLGAARFGIAALYIASGLHEELAGGELPESLVEAIVRRIEREAPGVNLVGVMKRLVWKDRE